MDDDVTIEVSSLTRTSILLSLLKEENRKSFISGAMFRMDTPWVLHESTAGYYPIQLHYKKFKAPFYFFKKKITAFDFDRRNMELRIRSFKKIAGLSWQFMKLSLNLVLGYHKIKESYKKQKLNINFWDVKNIPEND